MRIRDLIDKVSSCFIWTEKNKLVSVVELSKLIELNIENLSLSTFWLNPLYLSRKGLYEMYHYELKVMEEQESQRKEAREKLRSNDKECLERWEYCYVEVLPQKEEEAKRQILYYFDKVIHDESLKKEIISIFGEFNIEKLYFEVYIYDEM